MNTYTFVIGSMDDFEGIEDLMDYVDQEGTDGHLDYAVYEFDEPADLPEDTITLIGRGMAFSNDWSMAGSYSFLVRGQIQGSNEVTESFDLNLAQCSEV